MKKSLVIKPWGAFVLLTILATNACAEAQSSESAEPVPRYLRALQDRDMKTVVDLTAEYQSRMARIRAQNPQVMWVGLLGEYYDTTIASLQPRSGYWRDRSGITHLRPGAEWEITETRTETANNGQSAAVVYVTVHYPVLALAPIVGTSRDANLLKETILEFRVAGDPPLVAGFRKLRQADVYWGGDPETEVEVANRLFTERLDEAGIGRLEALEAQQILPPSGRTMLANISFAQARENVLRATSGKVGILNRDWRPRIDRALSLNPDIRERWVAYLADRASGNADLFEHSNTEADLLRGVFRSAGAERALRQVRIANEFAAGSLDLEMDAMLQTTRTRVVDLYLWWASLEMQRSCCIRIGAFLQNAVSVSPGEATPRVIGFIRSALQAALDENANPGLFRSLLEAFESVGVRLGPANTTAFLRYADASGYPDNWTERVMKLSVSPGL